MSWTLAVALYFIIWWTLLFAVLPFGVRTQGEDGEVVPGTPASAPTKPRLLRVALINTVAAAVVLALVNWVIVARIIDFSVVGPEPPGAGVVKK